MAHHILLLGYYRVIAENNIAVDFIHRKNLEEDDLPHRSKAFLSIQGIFNVLQALNLVCPDEKAISESHHEKTVIVQRLVQMS